MQRARVSNHPCHRLSVPAAKRFWCRHCMMVFDDAITRWRHSRTCRTGGFDNFVRRREIETQALQKMAETLDPDLITSIQVSSGDGEAGNSKELCCFICRQRFISLDEMREHVKYPCNKPATLQRPSMTVYIEEPTFGTGIQQHYTDGPVGQYHHDQCSADVNVSASSSSCNPHPLTFYMNDSEQPHTDGEAKPTNIYVNEKGETVIEVENLDLNTKSGELSLAHLLTQLSQQGIVFDQQPQGETEASATVHHVSQVDSIEEEIDYSQPTLVDAANTLTQLAGSAFRASSASQESYIYAPPLKRIKTEDESHYLLEQEEHLHGPHYLHNAKDVETIHPESKKFIICTNESEVISVVRADDASAENSNCGLAFENGPVSMESAGIDAASEETTAEEAVVFNTQSDQACATLIMLQAEQSQNQVEETTFKDEHQVPEEELEQTGELLAVHEYGAVGGSPVTVSSEETVGLDETSQELCSQESSDNPAEPNIQMPQIISIASTVASEQHVILQQQSYSD